MIRVDGKQKTDCYVFDFAPDRTLKVLTETVHLSRKPGKSQKKRREAMTEFLNYCPVISISGSKTRKYSVESMMEQIKQIYAERAVNSGFEDESLYNDELLKLDEIDASKFNELNDIIGASKASNKKKEVLVNGQGLTDEQIEHIDDPEPPITPDPDPLTPEEIAELQKLKQAKEARKKAIDILRGISIRMPLMIYGADVPIEEDIDIDRFVDIVDDESWKEFMPSGVTKQIFTDFIKYYDCDVFVAAGNPFDYQKANRLVYCNLLEHSLLHVKIAKNPDAQANENQLPGIGGAINFICKDLNDIYADKEFTDDWRKAVAEKVKDSFDDYIAILRYLWSVIESNPIYKAIITKDMLCVGWDGKVVKEVMNALNDGE